MANTLPIGICFFTSTKGHFGSKDLYAKTLDHLDDQIPLESFGALYAHIKVTPGEEDIGLVIEKDLISRGFTVEKTVAPWVRGMVHQQEYLKDIIKSSQSKLLHSQPYTLMLEDDSLFGCSKDSLIKVLSRTTAFFDKMDIASVRFLRASDLSTSPILASELDYFYSPHVNFNLLFFRSRDFYLAGCLIEKSWSFLAHIQCEMVMRMVLNELSRNEMRHIVWHPSYAETIHIGVENHQEVLKNLIKG